MLSLLFSLTAFADDAPLVPRFSGKPRTIKVDLFAFAPGIHPWGSDWKVTMMEQWSAVLTCRHVEGRVEQCEFQDGVWWGAVVHGTDQLVAHKLPAPGTIEITWTPRGRVAAWDVKGDRDAFWTAASNTMLQMTYHRPDVVFKPDGQREIGQSIEQSLVRQLAGALEWELPKKGETGNGAWQPSQAPWVGRRWVQSISSHKITVSIAEQDADHVGLALSGRVSERVAEGSMNDFAVDTTVVGKASFDRGLGAITQAWTETLTASTMGPLVGHTRFVTLVEPFGEGDDPRPADMPEPTL